MTDLRSPSPSASRTPTDSLLTASLLIAPLLSLATDTVYAVRGWDDAGGGVLHVLGAVAFGLVTLRVADWLPRASLLGAAIVLTGVVGLAGNVAYGFEAIHASLGDTALVDQPGAANLIKPLGLFFPLALVLVGVALVRLGRRWQGVLTVAAMVVWPAAHVANVGWLAVVVNVALVAALGTHVPTGDPAAAE